MSKIHYFQRYSIKENFVTNNALHLLKRIYLEGPKIFENVLGDICGEKSESVLEVGPSFEQQTGGNSSVPDGKIRQKPFNLLVETKLGDEFDVVQLKNHMGGFKGSENNILIGICRSDVMPKVDKEELNKAAVENNCLFEIVTFSKVISTCRTHIPDFRLDLIEMLDDFEEFCEMEDLLEPKEDVLLAFPCSDSAHYNIKFSLYYRRKDKTPKRKFQYVGFYGGKTICGIGRLALLTDIDIYHGGVRICDKFPSTTALLAELWVGNKSLEMRTSTGDQIQGKELSDLLEFTRISIKEFGWMICNDHSFYFLEKAVECNFKKTSSGPMQNYRYFSMGDIFSGWTKEMDIEEISKRLSAESWE